MVHCKHRRFSGAEQLFGEAVARPLYLKSMGKIGSHAVLILQHPNTQFAYGPAIEVKGALQKLRLFNASSQPSAPKQSGRTGVRFNYNAHFQETSRDNTCLIVKMVSLTFQY
jgi:hypothetical protein